MSTYKAHIFKQRKVGEREEVKLKIFAPDGSSLDLGGGGGSKAFDGWSNEVQMANNAEDIVIDMGGAIQLDQGDVRNNASAGLYVVKLRALWGAGSALTNGAAQIVLMHIAEDDSESVLASLIMSPEPNLGDMLLSDVHAVGEKIDMGSAPEDGRLELRAMQSTDQNNMSLTTRVAVAKL